MTAKKQSTKKGGTKGKAEGSSKKGSKKQGAFNSTTVLRILAKARKPETEPAYEAMLIAEVLGMGDRLDAQTHFDVAMLTCALYCKIKDMPGPNRQALFSDPDFARAIYRHIQQAFPKKARAAFNLYFKKLDATAPGLLDGIQRKWDGSAGEKNKKATKKGGA